MTLVQPSEQPMAGRVAEKTRHLPRPGKERIGDRLSRLRRERGISQTDLGNRIGVDQRIVSCYENHQVRIPAETLLKIADVLHVSVYELLGRATAPRAPKNRRLWKVLEEIEALKPRDQTPLLRMIEGYIYTAKTRKAGSG